MSAATERVLIKGNEAVAFGAIDAGCRCYFGYPITPQNEVPEATALAIAEAKREGRPVIAVGTTSLRSMEGVAELCGRVQPFTGWTDIFLYPGRPFRVVDGLLTNFHLPESSLIMLVSALAGRKRVLAAYAEAVSRGYRFFSYGDAMLIR